MKGTFKMKGVKKTGPLSDSTEMVREGTFKYVNISSIEKNKAKPSLLLHSCCGPCSTAVIERLYPDYDITVFFYNPNITDEKEYIRRKKTQMDFIKRYNDDPTIPCKVGFREGPYDVSAFYRVAATFASEPEGGRRCQQCFALRLEKTAETAKILGFDMFATTLSISPHKDYDAISHIGKRTALMYKVGFLDKDFKKNNGYARSIELSKIYGLYRQDHCGCEYSKKKER